MSDQKEKKFLELERKQQKLEKKDKYGGTFIMEDEEGIIRKGTVLEEFKKGKTIKLKDLGRENE